MLNYKAFSFIIAITLLIIVSSGNTAHIAGSNAIINNIQTPEQSDLAIVSVGNHVMNDDKISYDSIQTNTFEPNWVEKMPLISPDARQHSAMAYDSDNDKMILFGGHNGSILGDTWAYDYKTNNWEEMKPSAPPAPMWRHAMVYDPDIQKIVLFGEIETWTYDYVTNEWEQQFPQVSPSTKSYHSMVYDTTRRKVMLLGGSIGVFETWEMDSTTFNWTNLFPVSPIPLLFAMAASYDQANDKIIVFGGQNSTTNAGDTYAYDYTSNEWTLLEPLVDPSDRRFYGRPMGYDTQAQKSVLFGGRDVTVTYNETWVFDYATTSWELIPTIGPSPGRWIHMLVFNSNENKFIMFGGNNGTTSDQTYQLSIVDTDPPLIISPGDKFLEIGSVSSSISWHLLDPSNGSYEIKLDNQIIDVGNFADGQIISLVPFGLNVGDYVLSITATDLEGNSASDTINLHVVEVDSPIIVGPEDLEMDISNSNKNITWILEDLTPTTYNVTQNGTLISEGEWQNGDNVTINLDALPPGYYIFQITVLDAFDHVASDTVSVTITGTGIPSISHPTDMDIVQGDTNKEIIWYISDNNPTFYVLEVNQQVIANNSWVALPFVSERLAPYVVGSYNFTLSLHDGNGNIVSDTVIVTVHPASTTTGTPKPPSGGSGGGGFFGGLPSIPREVAIGAGILGGGTLIYGIFRRSRGGGGF